MIFLTCGVPGSGKTLWTVSTVEARRIAENRKVFYSGIAELALDWEALPEGADWDAVPDGSIVVVDECQRLWPVRKQGSVVPENVRRMETHRHRGIDLYLVSQNPLQLDTAVRHLVGEYRFLSRPFGHSYSVVWRFGHVCDWRSTVEQQKADKIRWKFPATAFGWYKSAEVHTHKKSFPRMVYWVVPLVLLVGGASYMTYRTLHNRATVEAAAPAAAPRAGVALPEGVTAEARTPGQIADSVIAYLQARTPRVREMPESAPVYDSLATPVAFPRVAACYVARGRPCRCVTQQGTPVSTVETFCVEFVKHGAFDPYHAPVAVATGDREAAEPGRRGVASPKAKPSSMGPTVASAVPLSAKPGLTVTGAVPK